MREAIVIAIGAYRGPNGKVAHGLVRDSERFRARAVVDPDTAGQDAGEVLDGIRRDIPVTATLAEARRAAPAAEVAIVGLATHGGRITPALRDILVEAARAGLSIVSGLHDLAGDDDDIAAAAATGGGAITDLRRPPKPTELRFWSGDVRGIRAQRIAVLGTDCALGKRTTARVLAAGLRRAGIAAEFIYTGQTGWMQGGRYGIILDSLPNDYVSGELEGALCRCDREVAPDVMVIEGQSSLRNPSGPCGAEMLVSGGATGVVLQHAPGRPYFEGYEEEEIEIPPIDDEVELIRLYGAEVIALALSREGLDEEAMAREKRDARARFGVPAVEPLADGAGELVRAAAARAAVRPPGEPV